MPTLLAHGALGNADEIILIAVGVGFFILMGISFVMSRNKRVEDANVPQPETSPDQPDRFRLD
jgi:hypothetical protein